MSQQALTLRMWRWSNGEGKVITTRLLKRDLPVLFQLGQDCLNEFPTSLNFYRYGDHFSFTERSAALRALDTALFFQIPAKGLDKEALIFGSNTES
ncbi:hypothetical protein N9V98_03600 [Luminiphilus sp.]|nr:hypothetical protein [Luminiphilus sp.]MDC0572557.1 hypothetical protein [Luminiphilus sp.]